MTKQYCERCKHFDSEKYCMHPLFSASPPKTKPRAVCLLFESAVDFYHTIKKVKYEGR